VRQLQSAAPKDTIFTNGAGNYATWAHRFYSYGGMRTQLAPTSGAMGYGVPAAIAAKIIDPQRTVVTFAGDGEYLMNGQELATAVQYRAGVIIIVFKLMFGTIRMHRTISGPGIGHHAAQPGFRSAGEGVWRAGRSGDDDRAVRAGFRARAGTHAGRQSARADRIALRRQSDHAGSDAGGDPGDGVEGEGLRTWPSPPGSFQT
jgi:hypothetical protein